MLSLPTTDLQTHSPVLLPADFCLETQLLAFFHEMDPEGLGYLQKVCLRSMMSANIGLFKTTDPRDLDHVFDCLEFFYD